MARATLDLERLSPLAVAAIGGLLLGTLLSLFYLPLLCRTRQLRELSC